MEYTTLRLKFVCASRSGQARKYENADGARQWIPVSITKSTTMHAPLTPQHLSVHEVTLPDWWIERNPWPKTNQQQLL